ncbi:LLM class flavin-dependent oxidoreductase [Telmatospirillum sp. J64-1]|uniref:LLM class flavin-dependent oxidoreductase n=1 Tax=Telmatospirillum sp. J64-1 TaxID=2502183 RepID=UPI00115DA30C|nr:LLM class flavin-dependent oxidoreductase [Telmatospirillum sp. J64-1]
MMTISSRNGLQIYTTCPQSKDQDGKDYPRRVIEVAQWSEAAGCAGILIYTDNSLADPWLVAQVILQNTRSLLPLVAVQPLYMHPYAAAKKVASLALLHDRRIALNMLAGGFRNDLLALGDDTPHDDRYRRTTEYALILKQLLESPHPVRFEGRYYRVKGVRMQPPLPPELFPEILISGSSAAGLAAAEDIGATAVVYPKRLEAGEEAKMPAGCGARIGIIARKDGAEAWRIAHERFPEDRPGELTHQLAMKVSDSVWHKQLSETETVPRFADDPYWLRPFQTYKTFCPYLVGSYERTAAELVQYITQGHRLFIMDIPPSYEEIEHMRLAFQYAQEMAA